MSGDPLDIARDVPERDTTPQEEAAIVALADAAVLEAASEVDAAEMLVCAATLVLARAAGPRAARDIFAHLAAVQRVAFERSVQ